MKFCPVVPEICRGQVRVPKKERRRKRRRIIIIIIIRNEAKTISLPNLIKSSHLLPIFYQRSKKAPIGVMSGVNMNVLQNSADKISLCILERTRMYSC
jgi:hypothetical protein